MKKLLLLCFPITTLAQFGAGGDDDLSYYYPSEESVSDGGAYYDGGITHVVDFAYDGHNYPDSVYAFLDIFSIQIFGSLNYYSSEKIQSVFLDISGLGNASLNYTYDVNTNADNKVKTFEIIEDGEARLHTFFYDINDKLIKKNTSVGPPNEAEYQKIFTYNSSGKLIQMDYFLLPDTNTPIQTDVLTYNMSDQLQNIELSPNGVKYEYGYNAVTNFCETVIMFYNNNYMDTVVTREHDANGNMIRTSIWEYKISTSPPTLDDHTTITYTYDSYNRNIKEEYWNELNQLTGTFADYIYFSPPSAIEEHTTNKELLKVTDLLGRETKGVKNKPLFYIYEDGTVEKRIIVE